MKRSPWAALAAGFGFLALTTSAIARPLLGGLLGRQDLALLTDPSSTGHVALQVVGGLLVLYGLVLVIVSPLGRSVATPSRPPPPSAPRTPSKPPSFELPLSDDPETAEGLGDMRRAGDLYQRRANFAAAARCYTNAALAEKSESQREILVRQATQSAQQAGKPQLAADLLSRLGQLERAAEILRAAGDLAGAAKLLLQAGNLKSGVETLEAIGDYEGAARALAAAGQIRAAISRLAVKSPRAAAELAAEHQETKAAIALYFRAGEFGSAAALLDQAGDFKRAAGLYQRAGNALAAARAFEQGGALPEAAQAYMRGGDAARAALIFSKLGDRLGLARSMQSCGKGLEAARLFLEAGEVAEADRILSALPEDQKKTWQAQLLLASQRVAAGKADDAIAILRRATSQSGLTHESRCEIYYQLGVVCQAEGDFGQATLCFKQVLILDPKYRDAPLRLAAVGKLLPEQEPFYADAAPAPPAVAAERVPLALTTAPVTPAPLPLAPADRGQLDSDTRRVIPQRYELGEPLGSGSMGVVYRGRDTVLDRPVAVKVLNSGLADAETLRRYFLREAKVMASLNHPHIVTIFDVGANEAAPYLVMEYLVGSDLTGPAERREISERAALRYTSQVASALGAVHGRGFLHRDVKPANVFLLKDEDRVKLMDFGVARGLSGSSTAIVGTPDYMAPEQILGEELGPWTDIYALGGMLFTLLTGEPPFAGGNALAQAIKTPPRDPRTVVPSIRAEVAEVVLQCLDKKGSERPRSAQSLSIRLTKLAETAA